MSWITDNKGEGPWGFTKDPNWSNKEVPWSFVKQEDKPAYNEGDHIAYSPAITGGSPVWTMEEGSNLPITPTHNPCGYWTKGYVYAPPPPPPPPSPPTYVYFGCVDPQVLRFDPTNLTTDVLTTSVGTLYSCAVDTVRRVALFGKTAAGTVGVIIFIDLDTFTEIGSVTLAADEKSLSSIVADESNGIAYVTVQTGWVIKLNIVTMTRVGGRLNLTDDFHTGEFNNGANYGDIVYFADYSGDGTKLFKVVKSTFTDGGYITPGDRTMNWQGAEGKELIEPSLKLLYFVLKARFANQDRLIKISLDSFLVMGYIDLNPSVPERWAIDPVIDVANRKMYIPITWTAPKRLIKIDLASFTRVAHINIPLSTVYAAVFDKYRDYIYVAGGSRVSRVNTATFTVDSTTYIGPYSIVSAVIA
jgi:hypothetical protein